MVSFTGIILAVLVFTEVLEQVFLFSLWRYADEHFTVGFLTVLKKVLEGIEGDGLLAIALLDELERGHITMALCDVDIQTVACKTEHQLSAL